MNKFKKGDMLMLAYKDCAYFPIMQIINQTSLCYLVKNIEVDNDYDKEGEEYILPKYWNNMYIKVKLLK